MGCISPNVQSAAEKAAKAAEAIAELDKMINKQKDAYQAKFDKLVSDGLASAGIKDARQIEANFNIKTEFSSEFSLDKIAGVVTSALDVLKAVKDPAVAEPATSPAAIESYKGLVNKIAEAAKSNTDTSASLAFSMVRLTPGIYTFLYAFSASIKDTALFGSEAVSTTAIFYRFIQSIDDVKLEQAFGDVLMDRETYIGMKEIQAALVGKLAAGDINVTQWMAQDAAMAVAVKQAKDRFDANSFGKSLESVDHEALASSKANQKLVKTHLGKLASMSDAHAGIAETVQSRLDNDYF